MDEGIVTLTEPFVLHPAAVLVPVSELSQRLRVAIACEPGDFTISKRNSRTQSKIIDGEAAALIREFEHPSTVATAVARFSRGKDQNAEALLEAAIPLVQSLIAGGLLVPAESAREPSAALPALGDYVDGWQVLRCVQALEDSELYQVRGPQGHFGALKICRSSYPAARDAMLRETRILQGLDSVVTPALLGYGVRDDQPYVITGWLRGTEVQGVCAELRAIGDVSSRHQLLRVTGAILKAYAHLHGSGVIHGDVHPRNVLIDRDLSVKIVDFGYARLSDATTTSDADRAGISYFWEPELANAVLGAAPPPPVTFAGEQFSLAALLYLLLTGSHYADFVVEKNSMLRQLADAKMAPFAERNVEPWPAAEEVLRKALSSSASDRFASVSEFSKVWESIELTNRKSAEQKTEKREALVGIRRELVAMTAIEAEPLHAPMHPPTASISYGSAGIALGLHRIACVTDDAQLFAQADCWSARALRDVPDEGAFYAAELDVTPGNVGGSSLYHGPSGVYAVAALIANARGDDAAWAASIARFVASCQMPCHVVDLTLGTAGALLGCTLLLEVHDDPRLRTVGADLLAQLQQTVDGEPQISESSELTVLGVAHGWAGLVYAVITWCIVAREPFPASLERRLNELWGCAYPIGRGLAWPNDLLESNRSSEIWGWCNGSAGYVFLWTAAYRATGDQRYLDLAERAAWNVWEMPTSSAGLCCGTAGQVYALLNYHRHCGDESWLRRAQDRASHAKSLPWRRESLYKGDLGLAVLAADLENPEYARMPMFECDSL